MKVVIIGGSNSIMLDGWAHQLEKKVPGVVVHNRAVGNTSSEMGYYRIISGEPLQAGDIVVWEYALNDEQKILDSEVSTETCLRYVELSILNTLSAGAKFIPLIFEAKDFASAGRYSLYKLGLKEMFSRYGVPFLDVTESYCARHASSSVDAGQYLHRVHYKLKSEAVAIAVEGCLSLFKAPAPPFPLRSLCLNVRPEDVHFSAEILGGVHFNFKNSALDIFASRPTDESPLIVKPLNGLWLLVGAIMLRNRRNGHFRFSSPSGQTIVRSYHVMPHFEKPLMGMVRLFRNPKLFTSVASPIKIEFAPGAPSSSKMTQNEDANDCGIVALQFERVKESAI